MYSGSLLERSVTEALRQSPDRSTASLSCTPETLALWNGRPALVANQRHYGSRELQAPIYIDILRERSRDELTILGLFKNFDALARYRFFLFKDSRPLSDSIYEAEILIPSEEFPNIWKESFFSKTEYRVFPADVEALNKILENTTRSVLRPTNRRTPSIAPWQKFPKFGRF